MPVMLSMFIPFVQALLEGGEGEPHIPVYQLLDMYWWGALLLISLIIFVVWVLISWQSRYFDGQLQLAGTHAGEHEHAPAYAPVESLSPARQAPQPSFEVTAADDLTLIEGIGPAISRLLQSKGITTFAQLAQADPEDLNRFLREANLRLADTSTWAEQARLADAGDFDSLRTYQSRLKGGREV
jgi:predicted flap endonuclease-1-like 5' DNA nuclease